MENNVSTLYVSQKNGDDSFSGTCPERYENGRGPYKTIERALDAVADYRKSGKEHPMFISLVDDYYLSTPINIDGLYGITIESYKGRKRVIGGIPIDNWKYGEFNGKKCLFASVPENIKADFTDFYVCGDRAHVTRFPKEGKLKITDADNALIGNHRYGDQALKTSKCFFVNTNDLASVDKVDDAIIHYDHYWIDEHSPIESYDKNSGRLVMKYASRFSVSADYEKNTDAAPLYYLTNVPNCFLEPCDWYLDRSSRTVYYIPADESITPESIEAFAPISKKLFVISGEDIHIRNLELTCTKGDYASTLHYTFSSPNEKFFASDIQSFCGAPGAISFTNAQRCGILNCSLHGVGIYGIEILKSCRHIKICDNHIYDVCAGGIRIAGGTASEDPSLAVSDCIISGNHIHGCGKRYLAGCGILLMNGNHCEISYNEIHDLEYSGISVGWVWGYNDSATYGNTIRRNHVYDVGKGNLSDLAGIYLLGKQRGTVVTENVVHDVKCYAYGAWGIYLDEGSSYITVERNIVYRTGKENFYLHYGSHNTARENLFLGVESSCIRIGRREPHEQITFEKNLFITDTSSIYGDLRTDPKNLHTDCNILFNTKLRKPILWKSTDQNSYDLASWQSEFGNDQNSIITNSLTSALSQYDFQEFDYLNFFELSIDKILNNAIK